VRKSIERMELDYDFVKRAFSGSLHHAEAFAGRAEQRQVEDRQGVEQQQTVAPLRIADGRTLRSIPKRNLWCRGTLARSSTAWRRG